MARPSKKQSTKTQAKVKTRSEKRLPPRLSYTQLSTAQRCWTRFFWQYILGLRKVTPSPGLLTGSLLHEAYDTYMFKGRKAHDDAYDKIDEMANEALEAGVEQDVVHQTADTAQVTMGDYLPVADRIDQWELVLPNGKKQGKCEVNGEYELQLSDGTTWPLFFKLDALVRIDGHVYLLENKFSQRMESKGLLHDLQILLYQAVWNAMAKKKDRITGVIYNIVGVRGRKKDGDFSARRADTKLVIRETIHRGPEEEALCLKNAAAVAMDIKRQAKVESWPMNARKECDWDCDFVGMCLGVRAGATVREYVETGQYERRFK